MVEQGFCKPQAGGSNPSASSDKNMKTENLNPDIIKLLYYEKGYSVKEILRMALEIDGYSEAKIIYDPSKPSMIPIRLMDISKSKEILGFTPTTDLREGIKKTIEWYRKREKI